MTKYTSSFLAIILVLNLIFPGVASAIGSTEFSTNVSPTITQDPVLNAEVDYVESQMSAVTLTVRSNGLANGPEEYSVSKFDETGNKLWTKAFDHNTFILGSDVAQDSMGNVFIVGGFMGTFDFNPDAGVDNVTASGFQDPFITKLDANGNYLWTKKFTGISSENARNVIVDSADNIYVDAILNFDLDVDPGPGVQTATPIMPGNRVIVKLDNDGNFLLFKVIPTTIFTVKAGLDIDSSNNIYTSGQISGTNDVDPDAGTTNLTSNNDTDPFVAKYNANLELQWAAKIDSPGGATPPMAGAASSDDSGHAVVVDMAGNVYAVGRFNGVNTDFDPTAGVDQKSPPNGETSYYLVKYNNAGVYQWSRVFGRMFPGTQFGNTANVEIALDGSENPVVVGTFIGSNTEFDSTAGSDTFTVAVTGVFITNYKSNGDYIRTRVLENNTSNYGHAIDSDSNGKLYILKSLQHPSTTSQKDVDFCPDKVLNSQGVTLTKYTNLECPPGIINVTSPAMDGSYMDGAMLDFQVQFSQPVNLVAMGTGVTLGFNTFGFGVLTGGSGTDTLQFSKTFSTVNDNEVNDLDLVSNMAIAGLNQMGGGSTLANAEGTLADITTPFGDMTMGSLAFNKDIMIDFTAPAPPVVVSPAMGSIVMSLTPTISGTAEPNSTVTVEVVGFMVLGNGMADAMGDWQIVSAMLVEGALFSLSVFATDEAGNVGMETLPRTVFTVDTTPPAAPTIVSPSGDTFNSSAVATGTAEANSTVEVFSNGGSVGGVMADAMGAWSVGFSLMVGNNIITAKAIDEAGNESPESGAVTATLLVEEIMTAPGAPNITTPTTGTVTNMASVEIKGTAQNGVVVQLREGLAALGTTTATGGNFTFNQTLSEGKHTLSTIAFNGAIASPESNKVEVTVDITAPNAPVIISPVNGEIVENPFSVSGTAEPGSTVSVANGVDLGSTTADASGSFTLSGASLGEGSHTIKATSTDVAGNVSSSTTVNIEVIGDELEVDTGGGSGSTSSSSGGTTPEDEPTTMIEDPSVLESIFADVPNSISTDSSSKVIFPGSETSFSTNSSEVEKLTKDCVISILDSENNAHVVNIVDVKEINGRKVVVTESLPANIAPGAATINIICDIENIGTIDVEVASSGLTPDSLTKIDASIQNVKVNKKKGKARRVIVVVVVKEEDLLNKSLLKKKGRVDLEKVSVSLFDTSGLELQKARVIKRKSKKKRRLVLVFKVTDESKITGSRVLNIVTPNKQIVEEISF